MHRFYTPTADFTSPYIAITERDELHHLRDVLRLKKGDQVYLFDGKGREACGHLLTVTSKKADVAIATQKEIQPKTPRIILACALPKKSKFELIIEKATELGVDEIIPIKTQRTEIILKGERSDKKNLRYQTVTINAAKQSKRTFIPILHPISEFESTVTHLAQTTHALIPSLKVQRQPLFTALAALESPNAVSFLIGPEGDFTSEEYTYARNQGCIAVSLGEPVLKVETAALCALSCANVFFHT